jgi:hypothetical protein
VGLSAAGVYFRQCLSSHVASTEASDQSVAMNGTVNQLQTNDFYIASKTSPDAVMYALHRTYQLAVLFAICGFICALFIKNNKLGSSIDENRKDTAGYTAEESANAGCDCSSVE